MKQKKIKPPLPQWQVEEWTTNFSCTNKRFLYRGALFYLSLPIRLLSYLIKRFLSFHLSNKSLQITLVLSLKAQKMSEDTQRMSPLCNQSKGYR